MGVGSGKHDAYFTDDHFSPRDVVPIFPCAARLAAPVYKLILRYNECVRSIMVEEVRVDTIYFSSSIHTYTAHTCMHTYTHTYIHTYNIQ